jgi:hypothetical protein
VTEPSFITDGRPTELHEAVPIVWDPPERDGPFDPSRHIVYVPVARFVEMDCDHCLRALERLGVRVDRLKGSSAIDLARNLSATNAIREGFESMMFIDSDMIFDPADAIKLMKSSRPVIGGLYAAKKLGNGQMNADFEDGIESVRIGDWADRLYPVRKIGTGFLRIKTSALKLIVRKLELPYCRMAERFGWPFFQPAIVQEDGETRYLTEDYAFCWRCRQAGLTPMADTSFRIYHLGDYCFGPEEACGEYVKRTRYVEYQPARQTPGDPALAVPPGLNP